VEASVARVLVVDDDGGVRLVARVMLEAAGHEVADVGDGGEAVRAFRGRPADLVLCDVFMPNKDGLQTIRELRALAPGVRVVAMSGGHTGFPGADFLCLAPAFGADSTLSKPFGRLALAAAVGRSLAAPAVA
jgi:CheY-like chemotaxis protein